MQDPGRGPQDAQNQTVARRRRNSKLWPKATQHQTVARRICRTNALETKRRASAAVGGAAKCAAGDTGLGAATEFKRSNGTGAVVVQCCDG